MKNDRFVEIKTEIKVTIDKNALERAGIPLDTVKNFIEVRLSSLAHRLSAWLTETLSSTVLLFSPQAQVKIQPCREKKCECVAKIIQKKSYVFFVPVKKVRAFRYRKYLRVEGRLVELALNSKRVVVGKEALDILLGLLRQRGEVCLTLAGKFNDRAVLEPCPE